MATILSSDPQSVSQPLFSDSATAQNQLGQRVVDDTGNVYRYVKAGGTALVPGKLQQSAAEITDHQNLAPTANAAIGATSVTVTLGSTAATANYYSNGWMIVTASTGAGYRYKIASHPAADSAATLTLTLSDALLTTLASSTSKIDLIPNPYQSVVVNPSTATSDPIGVAVYPITAAYFGWIQTGGVVPVLADGTVVVGTAVVASNATAGAVEALTGVQAPVGLAVTGAATTEYGAIRLLLDQ